MNKISIIPVFNEVNSIEKTIVSYKKRSIKDNEII
jgi:glycosyltransferase involved in cell wall biosynthesis